MRILPLLLFSFIVSCTSATLQQRDEVQIVLAATTDLHGWVEGHEEQARTTAGNLHSGGLDVLGGYLAILRRHHPDRVVLIDSGDLFQGTLVANLFEGAPVVDAYNLLEYDAVTVGNHEFDYGPVGDRSAPATASDDPVGALKAAMARASFPFLIANVRERTTGRRPAWAIPSVLVHRSGVDVGIIGVTTPDTALLTTPANVAHLDFTDPVGDVRHLAADLRRRGAEIIVVAAHMGGGCSDVTDQNNTSSCEQNGEVFRFARSLEHGEVDVIFGGHTHARVRSHVNGIAIAEAYPLGRGLALVDLWVRDGKLQRERTTIRPLVTVCEQVIKGTESCLTSRAAGTVEVTQRYFEGAAIQRDQRLDDLLEPYLARLEAKKREPLAIRIAGTFERHYVQESTLANLIMDVLRARVPGADFAVINSGGIRANLEPGEVTFGEMFEVLPFDNSIAILELTGAQLQELLRLGTLGRHGILQVAGLRLTIDDQADPNTRQGRLVSVVTEEGEPLSRDRLYKVVTTDFVASGGDGLLPLIREIAPERIVIREDLKLRELVIEELQRWSVNAPLAPKTYGRIKYVSR